ncbi:hypothetical protein ACX80E_15675 [Arthrobacter sp. TMN-49]
MFVWTRVQETSREHIRNHAWWTGVIAWALSSLTGATQAGIYDPGQLHFNHWAAVPWVAIMVPSAAVVAVHALGQESWPAPKAATRVALLQYRRARDYVQPALGWTAVGVVALTAVVMAALFFAPGHVPSETAQSDMPHYGRVPGYVLATALTAALAILVVGTVLVMRLIASRRSLAALSPEHNKTLRIIGMNRLLRVSTTVASGLAAVAGNHLAQPAPGSGPPAGANWTEVLNGVVLIAMLVWKPPVLEASATSAAGTNALLHPKTSASSAADDGPAAARFTNSASAAVLAAVVVGAVLGHAMRDYLGVTGVVGMSAVLVLLTYLLLEFILRRNYATPGTPRSTLRVLLPWPLYCALAVAAVGLVLAVVHACGVARSGAANTWDGSGSPEALYVVPAVTALVLLAVGLAATGLILTRPGLSNASPSLDRTLRRRSLFRIARTVTGGWYAILGLLLIMVPVAPDPNPLVPRLESDFFGALCLAAAVLVTIYPMRGLTPADFTAHTAAGRPAAATVGQ